LARWITKGFSLFIIKGHVNPIKVTEFLLETWKMFKEQKKKYDEQYREIERRIEVYF